MSPLYHGITVRDAVLMVHAWGGSVPAGTVRQWLTRGQVKRTRDGHVDPHSLHEWWAYDRDTSKVRTRAVA